MARFLFDAVVHQQADFRTVKAIAIEPAEVGEVLFIGGEDEVEVREVLAR